MDHILGCVLGGLVGDAAGAVLEFKRDIKPKQAEKAMTMPGGGSLNVACGQVTDDSELMMALFRGLKNKDPKNGFPYESVAQQYIEWYNTNPFDMGGTCRKAFGFAKSNQEMIENAIKYNTLSEANGSLMRIAPLAIWARDMDDDTIAGYAHSEALLSHPNPVCQSANAVFCVILAHLFRSLGDVDGAFERVSKLKNIDFRVLEWIEDSKKPLEDIQCDINIGHVKHAFTLALHFLRKRTHYEEAIYQTLLKGGDTDTNACIVGYAIGALHGVKDIPESMSKPVITFDCVKHNVSSTLNGHNRPQSCMVSTFLNEFCRWLSLKR